MMFWLLYFFTTVGRTGSGQGQVTAHRCCSRAKDVFARLRISLEICFPANAVYMLPQGAYCVAVRLISSIYVHYYNTVVQKTVLLR